MTPILEQPQIQDAVPPCGGAVDSWGAWTFAPPEPSVSSLRGGLAHCKGCCTRGRGSTGGRAWVHSSGFRISTPTGTTSNMVGKPPASWEPQLFTKQGSFVPDTGSGLCTVCLLRPLGSPLRCRRHHVHLLGEETEDDRGKAVGSGFTARAISLQPKLRALPVCFAAS